MVNKDFQRQNLSMDYGQFWGSRVPTMADHRSQNVAYSERSVSSVYW